MRILFIGPLPDPVTGQSLACRVLLDSLRERHDVAVVDLRKLELESGVLSLSRLLRVGAMLLAVLRLRWRSDVCYLTVSESKAGNARDLLIFALLAGQWGRVVIHLHGGAAMRTLLHGSCDWLTGLNKTFLRRIGAAVVLGPSHLSVYRGVVATEKTHIVPNSADDELFLSPDRIRRKFSEAVPLRVLFLSHLLPGKGYRELVEALRLLAVRSRATVHVDFAGGFENERDSREFLESIANAQGVRYHGVIRGAEKIRLFHAAHVFCLPTYYKYEGQPISMLEAYAAGCAVITTNHSGIRDVFEPETNGFEVEIQSPASLACAIERALHDRELIRGMGLRNRERAHREFRSETFCIRMEQVLGAVASAIEGDVHRSRGAP